MNCKFRVDSFQKARRADLLNSPSALDRPWTLPGVDGPWVGKGKGDAMEQLEHVAEFISMESELSLIHI